MKYNTQIRDRISAEIARGKPLTQIPTLPNMPALPILISWILEYADLQKAIDLGQRLYAEQLLAENARLAEELDQIDKDDTKDPKAKKRTINAGRYLITTRARLARAIMPRRVYRRPTKSADNTNTEDRIINTF